MLVVSSRRDMPHEVKLHSGDGHLGLGHLGLGHLALGHLGLGHLGLSVWRMNEEDSARQQPPMRDGGKVHRRSLFSFSFSGPQSAHHPTFSLDPRLP